MGLGTREATETFCWFFGTKNAPSHLPAAPNCGYYLTPTRISVNCAFFMATQPHTVSPMLLIETPHELDFPQREAAFFYGLFLRGHSPEQLRRDISVPPQVAAKWSREAERQPELRDLFERMIDYRRHVLAIFDSLIGSDGQIQRLQ